MPLQVGPGTLGGEARRVVRTPARLRHTPGRSRGACGYAGGPLVRGGVAGDQGGRGAWATTQDGRLASGDTRGRRYDLFDLRSRVDGAGACRALIPLRGAQAARTPRVATEPGR